MRNGPAGALFNGGQDSTDPNKEVNDLIQDLLQIEETLNQAIEDKKVFLDINYSTLNSSKLSFALSGCLRF